MLITSVGHSPASPSPLPADARTQPAKQQETQPKDIKPQMVQSTAVNLEKLGNAFSKKLQFVVDHSSHEVIVKVIDKETDKVIKELPPEELQRLHSNLKEAFGLLFDEMV